MGARDWVGRGRPTHGRQAAPKQRMNEGHGGVRGIDRIADQLGQQGTSLARSRARTFRPADARARPMTDAGGWTATSDARSQPSTFRRAHVGSRRDGFPVLFLNAAGWTDLGGLRAAGCSFFFLSFF